MNKNIPKIIFGSFSKKNLSSRKFKLYSPNRSLREASEDKKYIYGIIENTDNSSTKAPKINKSCKL